MRVYLDLCCLKRPFDVQDQALVRLETEAVLALLATAHDLHFLRSGAQVLENGLNPLQGRREAVAAWLAAGPPSKPDEVELRTRTGELMAAGFPGFDALHLASAELLEAEVFLTVGRPLLRRAARIGEQLRARVTDPVSFLQEVHGWTN